MFHLLGVLVDSGVPLDHAGVKSLCKLEGRERVHQHKCGELRARPTDAEHVLVEHEVGKEEDRHAFNVHEAGEGVSLKKSLLAKILHFGTINYYNHYAF